MLQLIKKVLILILLIGFVSFCGVYVYLIYSSYVGYRQIDIKDKRLAYLFNRDRINKIEKKYTFRNKKDDYIHLFTYDTNFNLIVWEMNQLRNIDSINIKISPNIRKNDLLAYTNIVVNLSHLIVIDDVENYKNQNMLFFVLEESTEVIDSRVTEKYWYFYMQFNRIGLTTDETINEIVFNVNDEPFLSNILFFKHNGKLFFIVLYSTKPEINCPPDLIFKLLGVFDD